MSQRDSLKPKYVLSLVVAASLILILGSWLRPRKEAPPPPSDTDLVRLARLTQRRSIENQADYFAAVAADVGPSVVWLPRNQTSGVVFEAGLIVTGRLARRFPESAAIRTASGEVLSSGVVWGPQIPLAGVRIPRNYALTSAKRTPATSTPNWMVAVWHNDRARAVAPGFFVEIRTVACGPTPVREVVSTIVLSRAMAGGGLFDADGNLLAVILPCQDRFAAVGVTSVATMLREADTLEGRLLADYGLASSPMTEEEAAYFKRKEGALVREVWTGHPGDAAGLQPGDIISSLNGGSVATREDLQPLVASAPDERVFALSVQRGSKTLTVTLAGPRGSETAAGPDFSNSTGLGLESPPRGYPIDRLTQGGPAAKAGFLQGDRLIRIGERVPRTLQEAQLVLSTLRAAALPVFVEVERDGRRLGRLLRAEPAP
ncbi:MAG: PDZ domain-containing protein [Vicinamibacteria bacterium]